MKYDVLEVPGWRRVVHFEDAEAGLKAIISVHDASLGPAVGGCRMRAYETFEDGLEDVKNLSRGMTYKNALGGIPFGGGKSVIFGDPKTDKTPQLFHAFGRAVESLDGLYTTAQDSGITPLDLQLVAEKTKHVGGLGHDGQGGDPSPFTARGVWRGVHATVRHRFKTDDLKGMRVLVAGVGAVGFGLCRLLHEDGAELVVADVNAEAVERAKSEFGATAVHPDEIFAQDGDLYAPCALGGAINAGTLPFLKVKAVAGAANNQLKTPEMGEALRARDILYAPDYVINAAGVISVGHEVMGDWEHDSLYARIDQIGDTLTQIFERAEQEGRTTSEVADQMALEIVEVARRAHAAE
ncbi:MAG: amino acid dehydrogenase [Pseudomonadota bacterium]